MFLVACLILFFGFYNKDFRCVVIAGIKCFLYSMDHSDTHLLLLVKKAFINMRPNTSRMYASRLKSLATSLDIPWVESDIFSPRWLSDPNLVMKVLMQQNFSLSTIRSYLTTVASYMTFLSFTCPRESDRAAAWTLKNAYRKKHSVIPTGERA